MMKSEPVKIFETIKVAFRSVDSVMLGIIRNVCVTGRASVACVKIFETNWKTKDGLTSNTKPTIEHTGFMQSRGKAPLVGASSIFNFSC